ncbi:hypothetical protein INT45_006529 [Circinella minor]|uniref:Uncharacterized protein n=1 Tax=Circinella minor TaxID=1195481 RepID=A0A8H7RQM3_9FUNG|nr:hypothetical protein INT45_006529 [Circinella minor]
MSEYSQNSLTYSDIFLLHEYHSNLDEEENINHHDINTTVDGKSEPVNIETQCRTSSSINPTGPKVVENISGTITYRSYDPDFLPLPLTNNPKHKRIELGLFFDVAQHLVSQKMLLLEIREEISVARNIMANRIGCRLSIILQELPSELERQKYIKQYIKTHIHDNFLTEDGLLHMLVNNFHNSMMEAKAHRTG